jgi:hypothetical protein
MCTNVPQGTTFIKIDLLAFLSDAVFFKEHVLYFSN